MWNSYDWGSEFEMTYLTLLLKGGTRSQKLTWNWLQIVWVYQGNNIVKFGWEGISEKILCHFLSCTVSFFRPNIYIYIHIYIHTHMHIHIHTYIYMHSACTLHINGMYILHISGGKLGHFTWRWNPSWWELEHWIFSFSFAISNMVIHRLTSWRKFFFNICTTFLATQPIWQSVELKGRVVSDIESYHLFTTETWVNAVYRHSAAIWQSVISTYIYRMCFLITLAIFMTF